MIAKLEAAQEFVSVPLSALLPDSCLTVSLFIPCEDGQMRLYRAPHVALDRVSLDRLVEQGHRHVYLQDFEYQAFEKDLSSNLSTILANEAMPITERFSAFDQVVRGMLTTTFRQGDLDAQLSACAEVADDIVDLVTRDDIAGRDLCAVLRHDFHTFTHVANVSYYCALLADRLGCYDHDTVHGITKGGLLHDLGKLEIPDSILGKKGSLTDQEFDVIRQHPTSGFRQLCRREDVSFGQLMMVYQHHERLDGRGYPVGIREEEIHPWAKICAVVDVFEALTGHRPYRKPMPLQEALEFLENGAGKAFDEEAVSCWTSIMKPN